jgi:hypothetical protein
VAVISRNFLRAFLIQSVRVWNERLESDCIFGMIPHNFRPALFALVSRNHFFFSKSGTHS